MRFMSRAALTFSLAFGVSLLIGCSEKCTCPEDTLPSVLGKHVWSKRFGDMEYQHARAVAVDPLGNVIVAGFFGGTVDFGGGALASEGGADIFVAKFGPDGALLWSKRFGDRFNQDAYAVAVDASGNVIVAGYFQGTLDFGGGALTSAGGGDIFVVTFGPDGAYLWSKSFGDETYQAAQAVAVDASGNVVVTGYFEGTVDFGGGALVNAGEYDIFVAKFESGGGHLWSKRFGDGNFQSSEGVAIDAAGNVIITGDFEGTVDFGGGAITSAGGVDIYIAKLESDGAHIWSKRFGDVDFQHAYAIAADASGNTIVAGSFDGTLDFGGGALTSAGGGDIFVAKFGFDGAHLWSKRFGNGASQYAHAVAVDASEDVIVTGEFNGTVDFGGGALTSAGDYDIFVAKFGFDGAHLWSKRFGDGNYQASRSLAADASRNVIIAGWFSGTVDFGGGALASAGDYDIYVAKFDR